METIEVKAVKGVRVPTPYGTIGSERFIEVPHDLYIRRRLDEGDLIIKKKKRKIKHRRKS